MTARFDDYGGFPRDRRIFVLAEPGPVRVRPFRPPPPVPPATQPCNVPPPVAIVASVAPTVAPEGTEPIVSWRERPAGFQPKPLGAAERRVLAYLEERAGRWHRLIDVARALDETPQPVPAVLDRAWRQGLVERRVKKAFMPNEHREFKWRGVG